LSSEEAQEGSGHRWFGISAMDAQTHVFSDAGRLGAVVQLRKEQNNSALVGLYLDSSCSKSHSWECYWNAVGIFRYQKVSFYFFLFIYGA